MRALDEMNQLQVMDDVGTVGDRQQRRRRQPQQVRERAPPRPATRSATDQDDGAERSRNRDGRRDASDHRDDTERPRGTSASPAASTQVARRHHRDRRGDERGDECFRSDAPGGHRHRRSGLVADGGSASSAAAAIAPMTRAPGSPAARSAPIDRVGVARRDDEDQADAHVERAQHVFAAGPRRRARASGRAAAPPTSRGGRPRRCRRGSTRGRLSVMPPPVMCAMPLIAAASSSSGRMTGRYERCGASSASATVVPSSGTRSCTPSFRAARTRSCAPASSRWCAGRTTAGRSARRPARCRGRRSADRARRRRR